MAMYLKLNAKYTVYRTASKDNLIDEKLPIYYIDHNKRKRCQVVSDIYFLRMNWLIRDKLQDKKHDNFLKIAVIKNK